ncbi:hypothetical protein [Winogradskyella arenosi]|uniref:hypothetical protein n=1 Tax=Winogradskyella arenosi TaxID=533325 RepID=UPI000DF32117|nr:hypothetical protein [Winogradskyella arenosi]
MKLPIHIKKISGALALLGLMVLLVFSPCKVRNTIQNSLEIPITKVSNKSISSLTNTLCKSSVEAYNSHITAYKKLQFSVAATPNLKDFSFYRGLVLKPLLALTYRARGEIPPLAPYYILYKHCKAYL